MNIKSSNLFKYIISLFIFVIGINFIIKGALFLKKNDLKFKNQINFSEINSEKEIILNQEKNDTRLENQSKSKENLKKKNLISEEALSEKIIIVKKNDTFSKIINPFFENNNIKNLIISEINKEYNLKNLAIGQKIFFYKNNNNQIVKINLPINFTTDIVLKIVSNKVHLTKEKINTSKEINSIEFIISSSLYEDGIKAGVPLSILTDAIRLYSFDIDFQRDIQKNTKFEVSYQNIYNSKRGEVTYGSIEYINLKIQNKDLEYFLFKTDDGLKDYFNKEGKNVKKSLLKTPIDGAQLSSSYGMRKHPILGYNKLHKGVDFAAAKGTPVFAGGNGVIDYVGNNGGYGKYIRIRHNNEYKTAYAHLSSFKKGIFKGKRINQGEIIGYVGSTGNSTGNHLHYEIIFQNKQINPMKMKLPSGKTLKGNELDKFRKNLKNIYAKHLFALYE